MNGFAEIGETRVSTSSYYTLTRWVSTASKEGIHGREGDRARKTTF